MSFVIDPFSDAGQATAAVKECLNDKFIHVAGVGWLEYTGKVWREVPEKVPLAELRRWATARLVDAVHKGGDGKGWIRRLDTPKLRNALTLAQGFEDVSVDPDQLDANPDLLNCRNGVVVLTGGDLIPHAPTYVGANGRATYLTRICSADYDPTALHGDWQSALEAIPEGVRDWLQTRFGQAITGHACPDDRVLIQQGGGANGKSTVLAGIAGALGDYYLMASDRILMGGQTGGATTDLADLRGARFVSIEETPEAGRLDTVRLKKVAGTARITARKLYQDNVSFPATHTLVVNTNYPPMVGETDEGTWRRLLLVVYPYTFTAAPVGDLEKHGDPRLRERLAGQDQGRAVLAWLVEGATRWYEQNRTFGPDPAEVVQDTDAWRFQTDLVGTFWSDVLEPDPDSWIYSGDLIWAFNQFLSQHGNSKLAESTFLRRFENHRATLGALVARRRVRAGSGQTLRQSRPVSLDPFARLHPSPQGQVWGWTGVSFRATTDQFERHASDQQERPG